MASKLLGSKEKGLLKLLNPPNPNPNFFGPDIFRWGWGSSMWRGGDQKVRYVLRSPWNQTFWRDIPGFLGGYPGGARKVWGKNACQFLVPRISVFSHSCFGVKCCEIFRFGHPNPGKRSARKFHQKFTPISRHFCERKTEKHFTQHLLWQITTMSDNFPTCLSLCSRVLKHHKGSQQLSSDKFAAMYVNLWQNTS